MTLPALQDLDIYQGDTYSQPFRLRKVDNTYQDFTGWTVLAQIRSGPTANGVMVAFTSAIATTTITISLTPAQTAGLPASGGQWDLQLTDVAGVVRTYLRGSVRVQEELSR